VTFVTSRDFTNDVPGTAQAFGQIRHEFTFSRPVVDPVFALASWGAAGFSVDGVVNGVVGLTGQ